jgi:hypothetical protein
MKYISIILLILFSNIIYSQNDLRINEKIKIRRELKKMLKQDQKLRNKIVQNKHSKNETDSLWNLQNKLDSINIIEFVNIINNYGYPSLQRVGTQISYVLILHFTRERDFISLDELFQKELLNKNMPNLEYAMWYDRCMILSKKRVKYGAYGKSKFCGDEHIYINDNRKSIGLELLNEKCE